MQSDLCGTALIMGSWQSELQAANSIFATTFIFFPIRTLFKRCVLLRRACLDDCTAALAAMPGGSGVCEEASEALYRARLLARRASAHVQLDELAVASGDYEEARLGYFCLQRCIAGVLDATQGIRMQLPWCELYSGRCLRP